MPDDQRSPAKPDDQRSPAMADASEASKDSRLAGDVVEVELPTENVVDIDLNLGPAIKDGADPEDEDGDEDGDDEDEDDAAEDDTEGDTSADKRA